MAKIRGRDELIKWLNDLPNKIEEKAKKAIGETAFKIERQAKLLCPIDTGHLRRSIKTDFFENGLKVRVGTNVNYSHFVEFGTIKQRPQPFLFPAFSTYRPTVVNEILNEIKKVGD